MVEVVVEEMAVAEDKIGTVNYIISVIHTHVVHVYAYIYTCVHMFLRLII